MYVVGTAGHVDHGKSTLIKVLTGIDPDRLPQEKQRGMTLDLGFAWMTLPSGRPVSIVDVPGHERFVRHMLAGVGAIDLALLIIAADEGIKPQTTEHLEILNMLQTKRVLVVVTKSDLVDQETLELLSMEFEDLFKGTVCEAAPIVAVSSTTGEGLGNLKKMMDQVLDTTEQRQDLGRPRLAIDRFFSVSGFGTVVTGTLIDGSFATGDAVEIVPSGQTCRIRAIQSHRTTLENSGPGRRLAINLSGVSKEEIRRGDIVTKPGWLKPTNMIDAEIQLVPNATRPLKHNSRLSFHLLVSETQARIRLLNTRELQPGEHAWAQIHLINPIPLVKGDLFILRDTITTVGGGRVVDIAPKRHRPFVESVLKRIALSDEGTVESSLLGALDEYKPSNPKRLSQITNLNLAQTLTSITEMSKQQQLVLLEEIEANPNSIIYSNYAWNILESRIIQAINTYHEQQPLRKGISKEEIRSRLEVPSTIFAKILNRIKKEGTILETEAYLSSPHHNTALDEKQKHLTKSYLNALKSNPYSPSPDLALEPELLSLLVNEGEVVKLNNSVTFSSEAYAEAVRVIITHIESHGNITVAQARTLLDSSRKYILPLLEYMDQQRITRRVGDHRILR